MASNRSYARRRLDWWLYTWLNIEWLGWPKIFDFTNDYPAMHGAYFPRLRHHFCRTRGHVWPSEFSWKTYCLRCRAMPTDS